LDIGDRKIPLNVRITYQHGTFFGVKIVLRMNRFLIPDTPIDEHFPFEILSLLLFKNDLYPYNFTDGKYSILIIIGNYYQHKRTKYKIWS